MLEPYFLRDRPRGGEYRAAVLLVQSGLERHASVGGLFDEHAGRCGPVRVVRYAVSGESAEVARIDGTGHLPAGCSAVLPGDGPLPIGIRVPPQFRGGRTGRGVGRALPAAAPLSVSVALPYGGEGVPRLRILSGRGVLLSCGRSLSFRDGVLSVCFRDGPYRLRGVCSGHGLRRLGTGVRIGYGRIPCSVGQYDCGLPYRCLFRDTGRSGEVKGRDQYPSQQCRRDGIPVRMPDALPLAGGCTGCGERLLYPLEKLPGRLFFVAAQGISYPFVEILICHLSIFSLSVPPRGMRRAAACRLSSAGPAAVRLARRRACMEPSAQYLYQFHPRPEVLRAGGRLAYSQHLRNFGIFVLLYRPQIEDGSVPFRQGVHARLYLSRRKFVEDRRRYGAAEVRRAHFIGSLQRVPAAEIGHDRIDEYPSAPTLERSVAAVVAYARIERHETVVQQVFRRGSVAHIAPYDAIHRTAVAYVQFAASLRVPPAATLYYLFQCQRRSVIR